MTEIVPQYYSFKIKLVISDSIYYVFLYLFITNKYRGFLCSSDVGSFILRIQSSMTTFTFLFETQFQDAIQSGDHDSNNFSIGKKCRLRDKL